MAGSWAGVTGTVRTERRSVGRARRFLAGGARNASRDDTTAGFGTRNFTGAVVLDVHRAAGAAGFTDDLSDPVVSGA